MIGREGHFQPLGGALVRCHLKPGVEHQSVEGPQRRSLFGERSRAREVGQVERKEGGPGPQVGRSVAGPSRPDRQVHAFTQQAPRRHKPDPRGRAGHQNAHAFVALAAWRELERAMGFEPTTFSLGS